MLGSILDPLADKTLMTILTVALASQSQIPFPLAALILTRDVSLTLGAAYYRFISLPKPVRIKTFIIQGSLI